MAKIEVLNVQGKKVKDLDLDDKVFAIKPNTNVVHETVVNYLANQRQGTQNTKTRSEVSGGGRKPWRQKGTGRARQGSIRAPQWIKGGIALGPKPRTYSYKINKKDRDLAVRSVLSSKVSEKEMTVLDKLELKEIKTAEMAKILGTLKLEGKTLVVIETPDKNVQRSARNIEGVKALTVDTLNVYDLVKYTNLLITEDAVKKLEEVYR